MGDASPKTVNMLRGDSKRHGRGLPLNHQKDNCHVTVTVVPDSQTRAIADFGIRHATESSKPGTRLTGPKPKQESKQYFTYV